MSLPDNDELTKLMADANQREDKMLAFKATDTLDLMSQDLAAAIIALRAENDGLRLNHAGAMSVASDMARDNAALRKRVEAADALASKVDDYFHDHDSTGPGELTDVVAAYRATTPASITEN
jgi:urease gamma subunit